MFLLCVLYKTSVFLCTSLSREFHIVSAVVASYFITVFAIYSPYLYILFIYGHACYYARYRVSYALYFDHCILLC
jgi:hypothetical protein